MSTKSRNTLAKNNPWNDILSHRDEKSHVDHDTHMLAFKFLGEIQSCQEILGVNRKELATRVGTSASYITQLYRGDKLPNLEILIKMAHALGIEFNIHAEAKDGEAYMRHSEEEFMQSVNKIRMFSGAMWVRRCIEIPENVYESETESLTNLKSDEINAIPA